jgi:callose synthase
MTHQEVYRIKLPGPVQLGEGKPENQNHAIIFTRGEALQAIDMNQVKLINLHCLGCQSLSFAHPYTYIEHLQDNYLEEAFKMRNLLEEFKENHGVRDPTILGVREHIFTGRYIFYF